MRPRGAVLRGTLILLFLWLTVFLVMISSQEKSQEPLTEEQVLSLVTSARLGELSSERIVELIQTRGVKFSVTEVFLLELQARQADASVVESLRSIRKQGKDFIPHHLKHPWCLELKARRHPVGRLRRIGRNFSNPFEPKHWLILTTYRTSSAPRSRKRRLDTFPEAGGLSTILWLS